MTFTARDLQAFLDLLEEQPQSRAQLRNLLIADDLSTWAERFDWLTGIVEQLAEAQRRTEGQVRALAQAQQRTEQRLEQLAEAQRRTEARLEQLAEAQQRTEERLERLEATVQALAEAQQRTEQRLEQLVEAQQRTEQRLEQLATDVRALTAEVRSLTDWQRGEAGRHEGERYERNMARQAILLFNGGEGGTPDQPIVYQRLLDLLRRLPAPGELTEEQNPFQADIIWWKDEHFAVVEVSLLVNSHDVVRAARRAETLQAANVQAIGVVIGEGWLGEDIRRLAEIQAVQWRVRNDLSDGYLAFCRRPA